MDNLELFKDILGEGKDVREELKVVILQGIEDAAEYLREANKDEEEIAEFLEFMDSLIPQYLDLYMRYFTPEEIVKLIEFEREPLLIKMRKFQAEIAGPELAGSIEEYIRKKDQEEYREYRRKAEDLIAMAAERSEDEEWDTGDLI